MIVISNQAAVGKGLLDPPSLEEITARMRQALLSDGVFLNAAYYCTHRSDDDCLCRKPKPGLLLRAAHDFNVDLSRSIFIGDSDTDLQAAQAAGCGQVLFGRGISERSDSLDSMMNIHVARTAKELFRVAVKCLDDRSRVASNGHVFRDQC
jgi:HAD superfamily hydrolase (TIGR01662 family)